VFAGREVLEVQGRVEPHLIDVNIHFKVVGDLRNRSNGLQPEFHRHIHSTLPLWDAKLVVASAVQQLIDNPRVLRAVDSPRGAPLTPGILLHLGWLGRLFSCRRRILHHVCSHQVGLAMVLEGDRG